MRLRRWAAIPGALAAAALTLAACVAGRVDRESDAPPAGFKVWAGLLVDVETLPVPLNAADPAQTAISGFRYAGGIAITSASTSRLHGLSDLVVLADERLYSVSDDGDRFESELQLDAGGRLTGLKAKSGPLIRPFSARLEPIVGLDGGPVQGKSQGDAEGLTRFANGDMLISFERQHRIWRYPAKTPTKPVSMAMPSVSMDDNNGMEGLAAAPTVGPDAYWVGVETGAVWLCRPACKQAGGLPKPTPGFRLSSLTTGPGGELVILHHSYTPGIGSRIRVAIVRDPTGAKTVIGSFGMGPGPTTDNFEGVAVVAKPNGDWRLYLLSDDNFNASQRTLLLAFDWTPPK